MRSFLIVMAALVLVGADAAPKPPDGDPSAAVAPSSGIDQQVLLVGEDRAVLPVPALPVLSAIELPAPDLRQPQASYPGPSAPPQPAWTSPAPAEVLALVEAAHA